MRHDPVIAELGANIGFTLLGISGFIAVALFLAMGARASTKVPFAEHPLNKKEEPMSEHWPHT